VNNEKWNTRFMTIAKLVATWSRHPIDQTSSQRNGCVIVNEAHAVLSTGYNGLPRGCNYDLPERTSRPDRSLWFEHAERNAIFNAAAHGVVLKGTTIYVPWFPCAACMRAIIQSGIATLVCARPSFADPKWGHEFAIATQMAKESGLAVECYEERDDTIEAAS
jgi:dCMP deaminase